MSVGRLRDTGRNRTRSVQSTARPGSAEGGLTARTLFRSLSEPLRVGETTVKYRFAHQRSIYLAEALNTLHDEAPPADDLRFRLGGDGRDSQWNRLRLKLVQ